MTSHYFHAPNDKPSGIKWLLFGLLILSTFLFFDACENKSQKAGLLVKQHCGSCHVMPAPGLLDKKTWEQSVLPEMAFRMGIRNPDFNLSIPPGDSAVVYSTLPATPMVTDKEWEAIRDYYLENAPDSLSRIENTIESSLSLFEVTSLNIPERGPPFVSMIKTDTIRNKIFVGIGIRSPVLYQFGKDVTQENAFPLKSPPSNIIFEKDHTMIISLLGILEPNEQALGELITMKPGSRMTSFIDSLQRPVYFEKTDLNHDKLDDYVICDFGNYTGALLAFENLGKGKFKRHVVYGLPGARKVAIIDANHDGRNDIVVLMAQGNEQIALLTNEGNFNFRITPLLRFPPVYGSSYFELFDFNRDGNFDILYANGDNGDFSDILKPYHGVRIFMNDGLNAFSESWFYPMYGASKAIARDFDKDGDLDIAAISFFPDFERHPEQGFLYFENTGSRFVPHAVAMASGGRWLVMDAADVDHDGDCDLLLGAFDYDFHVPPALVSRWSEKKISLLILHNTISKSKSQ